MKATIAQQCIDGPYCERILTEEQPVSSNGGLLRRLFIVRLPIMVMAYFGGQKSDDPETKNNKGLASWYGEGIRYRMYLQLW